MNRHQRRKESRRSGAPPSHILDSAGLRRFENAVALMKAGRWQEADFAHRSVLRSHPRHSPSLHHVGLIAFKMGLADEAIAALRLALEVEPNYWEARLNLAVILKAQGDHLEAVEHCRRVVDAESRNAAAHLELASILQSIGDKKGAISAYRRAQALQPDVTVGEWSLAQCLVDCGQSEESVEVCRRILTRDAEHVLARKLLVRTLASLGRLEDVQKAIEAYGRSSSDRSKLIGDVAVGLKGGGQSMCAVALLRDAIARDPDCADLRLLLGSALKDLGRLAEAFDALKEGLDRDPTRADGYVALGFVLHGQGATNGAITALRHAVDLQPEMMAAHIALGTILQDAGKFEESLQAFNAALLCEPRNFEVRLAITGIKRAICDWDGLDREETECISRLRASGAVVSPFQLIGMSVTNDDMRACGERYARSISQKVQTNNISHPYQTYLKPSSRIRIGYLSSDFCNHATSLLLAEVLELHDRDRFEVIGYCHSPTEDNPLRRRMIAAFDRFESIHDDGHFDVAERIRQAGVEILVDLKGYTRDARQEILALRPAPVQVSYLGYPATSGASYIDYILADAVVAPMEHQRHYSEKIVHLETCYQPNDRNRRIDPNPVKRAECGLPESGFVFCSFNNNFKLNRTFFVIWMSLLNQVPDSVLWLLAKTPVARENLIKEAQARGVEANRLVFAEKQSNERHLARHAAADLFLDSLPCTAHTTASDALWAGLPILTCLGPTFAGRVAASALEAIGLPELIATSLDDYVSKALQLARNPSEIADIKAKIAANRSTAPLFDTPRYVRSLERAFAQMSQLYRTGEPPRSLPADFS